MTDQEEVREGLKTTILSNTEINNSGDVVFKPDGLDNVFSYLHSQGVVLKVDRELPKYLAAVFDDYEKDAEGEYDMARPIFRSLYIGFNENQTKALAGYCAVESIH